jgi:co-chaperonin GroES (HSP10)
MQLRPIGDRVLIQPEIPANVTESGIILAEHRKPEQTGTVIAVGPCPHPLKAEAEDLAQYLSEFDFEDDGDLARFKEAASVLRQATHREPLVRVGDYVVFSWTAGQEIWVEDGEARYLLMREADILCVVEGLTA